MKIIRTVLYRIVYCRAVVLSHKHTCISSFYGLLVQVYVFACFYI